MPIVEYGALVDSGVFCDGYLMLSISEQSCRSIIDGVFFNPERWQALKAANRTGVLNPLRINWELASRWLH